MEKNLGKAREDVSDVDTTSWAQTNYQYRRGIKSQTNITKGRIVCVGGDTLWRISGWLVKLLKDQTSDTTYSLICPLRVRVKLPAGVFCWMGHACRARFAPALTSRNTWLLFKIKLNKYTKKSVWRCLQLKYKSPRDSKLLDYPGSNHVLTSPWLWK